MTGARQELLDMIVGATPYGQPRRQIEEMQLEATRELFAERREQIAVLRRRADESGVTEIRSLHDLVPLLFAHTVYKSYPQTFVEKGQWDRMLAWLQTLSVRKVTDTDVEGVTDADEWIARLEAAGHHILATSGTTGKCSFLNHARGDFDKKLRHWSVTLGWPRVRANQDRLYFSLGPSAGPNSAIEAAKISAQLWAKPEDRYFLTDEPLRITDISKAAALRSRMIEGTAMPSELEAFETEARQRAERMQEATLRMAEKILAHRHEPIVVAGLWAQHMTIIDLARDLGIPDGDFHPDSIIRAGGGIKGVKLPPDYKERVARFYGTARSDGFYGMTELAQSMPRCEAGRYHRAPGLIVLVLDQTGERLLTEQDGVGSVVEGRAAFLDLSFDGRWGGLISGDKIQVDYRDCPCGRPGPTVLDTITRYAQPGEADHIGCAGTIDSYIKGALAA
jgi:hypothetical protein